MADIAIIDVSVSPNPVNTNAEYGIKVQVVNKVYGILTKSGKLIMTKNGYAIERKGG